MNLTSAAMIGRINPEALGASTLGLALYNTCLMFGIGLTAAISPLVARERGSGAVATTDAIRRLVHAGFWNNIIVVIPVWCLLWEAAPVLRLLGQESRLADEAASYLHVMQWSLLPALIYLVLRSLLAALERPRWAVVTGVGAVVLNFVLNWLLIDGHAGLPALGLLGSGLATFLSNLFMAGALSVAVAVDPRFRKLRLFQGLGRVPWRACATLWRLGAPIGIGIVLEVGMFTAATALVGHYDPVSLPAHAIALQVASFTFMVPLGIAQAATVRVAGAAKRAASARAGWVALMLGLGVALASAVVLVTVPEPIIGLFIDPSEPGAQAVTRAAALLLGIAGIFQLADAAQVVLGGMLRGLQDTRMPMLIAMFSYWGVGLPLAFVLVINNATTGVWIGLTAGLFTVALLLLGRWWVFSSGGRRPPIA
ncbi:MATE family efflux transporter [Hyphomicrobiales bacterium BP6-180914]|uniref:MATE family efflux transporter n=2 Tax=Lichenifustis flavocetrariae TaxID=2949735 RepID=A0AA42CJ10_9HYPH|nr:MATE family efflux transporter [Lichenifustis flavocetrariae]